MYASFNESDIQGMAGQSLVSGMTALMGSIPILSTNNFWRGKMKLLQHIGVAKIVIDRVIKKDKTCKLNKLLFYIGSILPDLNCVYPAHRITETQQRVINKIKFIDTSSSYLLKSIQYGIVTHYVCDYFCYAHSIESLGAPHIKYEKQLFGFYKKHEKNFYAKDKMIVEWDNAKEIISNLFEKGEAYINPSEHADMVFELLKIMNNNYINNYTMIDIYDYNNYIKQCKSDMEYATFVCEQILLGIMKPMEVLYVYRS